MTLTRIQGFSYVTLAGFVGGYQHFGAMHCLHLQGWSVYREEITLWSLRSMAGGRADRTLTRPIWMVNRKVVHFRATYITHSQPWKPQSKQSLPWQLHNLHKSLDYKKIYTTISAAEIVLWHLLNEMYGMLKIPFQLGKNVWKITIS
jgi:hypothetical protein